MTQRKLWAFLLCLLTAFAAPVPLQADEAAVVADQTVTARDLTYLADSGKFDQLLASLKTAPGRNTPEVAGLIHELERYQTTQAEQSAKQREAYQKAYDKMNKQAEGGKLEEAIFTALLSRDLSTDKAAFLRDDKVAALIKSVEGAAVEAEKNNDWVEALSLYRSLDDLFDDYATYHKQVKRASQHVRVLRLYAPTELEKLLKMRLERRKQAREDEDKDAAPADPKEKDAAKEAEKARKNEEIHLDKEPWQQKLEGVDATMLKQALSKAAQGHVSSRGYATLLKGAADAMVIVADTKALATAFPAMQDAETLRQFRDGYAAIGREAEERGAALSFSDAPAVIDRMLALNDKTLKLPEAVVAYEMTEGAIDTLDEFSSVIWPHEKDSFARNFKGNFFGVGIQISQRDERLIVVSPLEATPAMRAGIKAGDIIAKVNDRDTTGWTLDQAVREITGEEGTPVTLGIERGGKPLVFNLIRAEIPIESIRGWQHRAGGGWDYYIDPNFKIGYVRLSQFIPQSADDLDAAMNQMEKQGGLDALILDLRFNPGGLLSSAVEVSNRFIPSGTVVSTEGPGGANQKFSARPDRAHRPIPVVVLVNQGSASASEIVSGALQDYHKALIVGTRSFGKGSVQDVFPIDKGRAYLKLTTQYYKLPNGRILHRKPEATTWGVEPNLKVTMTAEQITKAIEFRQKADVLRGANEPEDPKDPTPKANEILEKGLDPQLDAALLVLKTRMVADNVALAKGR